MRKQTDLKKKTAGRVLGGILAVSMLFCNTAVYSSAESETAAAFREYSGVSTSEDTASDAGTPAADGAETGAAPLTAVSVEDLPDGENTAAARGEGEELPEAASAAEPAVDSDGAAEADAGGEDAAEDDPSAGSSGTEEGTAEENSAVEDGLPSEDSLSSEDSNYGESSFSGEESAAGGNTEEGGSPAESSPRSGSSAALQGDALSESGVFSEEESAADGKDDGSDGAGADAEDAAAENEEKPSPFGDIQIRGDALNMDFSSRRLILSAAAEQIVDPVHILSSYDGIWLMQYASEEEARLAYSYYADIAAFAGPDIEMTVADGGEGEAGETARYAEDTEGAADTEEMLPAAPDGMTGESNPLNELEKEMASVSAPAGRTVAVIDTGISGSANVVDSVSMLGDLTGDDNGHGSVMAALIAEQDPDARIISVKAMGADGRGTISAVYAGMQYAMAAGADIILLSISAYSTSENAVLKDAVYAAVSRGITVIGAAGNNGRDAAYFTPGNIDAAVIVGAADGTGARIASSNYGATVDYNVSAASTSQAAAKLAGYLSKNGLIDGVNENGLIFTTDFVPGGENDSGGVYYLIDEDGNFVTSDSIHVHKASFWQDDFLIDIHFADDGRILYCVEYYNFNSGTGTYGNASDPRPLSRAQMSQIAYVIANGLTRMGARSNNPLYVAGRNNTMTFDGQTVYMSDYFITQLAVWQVTGDWTPGNPDVPDSTDEQRAVKDQCVALYRAAAANAGSDGTWHSGSLTCGQEGSTLSFTKNGSYYETAEFTVKNSCLDTISAVRSQGTGDLEIMETGSSTDKNAGLLVKKYRLRIPANLIDNVYAPGTYTWQIRLTGSDHVYKCNEYRQENTGNQEVVLLVTAQNLTQEKYLSARVVVPEKNGDVKLLKKSGNTALTNGNNCYSLAGAVYGVYASAANASSDSSRLASLTTGSDGTSNTVSLKAGTYYVREITASKGYAKDAGTHTVTVTAGQTAVVNSAEPPLKDPMAIQLAKLQASSDWWGTSMPPEATLEGAEYTIRLFAKENANVKTDKPAQTWVVKTVKTPGGKYAAVLDDAHRVSGPAAPYGKASDTGYYVLPLGTVSVQETKAPKGFKIDGTVYRGRITGESTIVWDNVSGGTIKAVNAAAEHTESPLIPRLATAAVDTGTGTRQGEISKSLVVRDTVTYAELIAGESYTLKSTLMNKETGTAVTTAEKTFKAANGGSGSVIVEFPAIDTSDVETFRGKHLVAFEELYLAGIKAAEHKDLNDPDQTVTIEDPKITTDAEDGKTGSHVGTVGSTEKIVDIVHCSGLIPGKTYRLHLTVMDKESGEPLRKEDGSLYEKEQTFTAPAADHDERMEIDADTTLLAGTTVVCFEELYKDDIALAIHHEPDDEDQSLSYPQITTDAADSLTQDHVGTISAAAKVIDTVTCTGLVTGQEYTVTGTLMLKSSGEPVPLLNEDAAGNVLTHTFTADGPSCNFDFVFEIDSSLLQGETAVAFEHMYHRDIEVAVHTDIGDEDQSVHYPTVSTTAADGDFSEDPDAPVQHIGDMGEEDIVTDRVNMTNLVPGMTYVLRGTLMDRETGGPVMMNGTAVTCEESFEAGEPDMSVDLHFAVDSTQLEGHTVVAFEKLFHLNPDKVTGDDPGQGEDPGSGGSAGDPAGEETPGNPDGGESPAGPDEGEIPENPEDSQTAGSPYETEIASHEDISDRAQAVFYPELPHKTVDKPDNSYHEPTHTWTVTQRIPDGFSGLDARLQTLVIEDELDSRLDWGEFVSLGIQDCEGEDLVRDADYAVIMPEGTPGGTLRIEIMTESGAQKLALNEGKILELKFRTTINESAACTAKEVGETLTYAENENDALIPNQASVAIGGRMHQTEIPFVYTAGIDIRKTDDAGRPLPGAVFLLLDAEKKPFMRNGREYALTSGSDGMVCFAGLENGTYYVRETRAPEGKELPAGELEILIERGVVTYVNGQRVNSANRRITVTDTGKIILQTGGHGRMGFVYVSAVLLGAAFLTWYGGRRRHAARPRQ